MVKIPARLSKWIETTNWQTSLFRLMLIIQCMYFIVVFLPLASNVAITAQRDLNLVRFLPAGLFIFGISQFWWGLKPRRLLITGLLAQSLFCFIVIILLFRNIAILAHTVPHIALLLLSATIIYRYSDEKGFKLSNRVLPIVLSVTMFGYAVGVLQQLDAGLIERVGKQWAEVLSMLLSFSFFWASGYLLHNHAKPTVFFVCLIPQFFYAIYVCFYFLNYPQDLSLIRPVAHITLSVFLFMLTAARAQEKQHGIASRIN